MTGDRRLERHAMGVGLQVVSTAVVRTLGKRQAVLSDVIERLCLRNRAPSTLGTASDTVAEEV